MFHIFDLLIKFFITLAFFLIHVLFFYNKSLYKFVMKLFYILASLCFVLQTFAVEKSAGITCLTSKCHSDMNQAKFLHSPIKAKGCVACHQLVSAEEKSNKLSAKHPSISLNMGKDQESQCLKCHVEWGRTFKAKKYAHSAINQKGCTGCHNPHGSDNAKLLKNKESTQELCLGCHKKNENWEKGEKETTHRAINVKNKCLNCHDIHSGDLPKMLKAEPAALCAKCHEEITANKDKGSLHTPVRNGDCLKCHSPHYAAKENLLDKTFESESYVKNAEQSFQLCFSCHGPFRSTKFRNGENNLHTLHVLNKDLNKDKERGCAICHEVHGSTQELQIRTSFTYKKVKLPIAFNKLLNGGTCTTACHGKKDYDRMSAVINKEGR
jgi:predicted CXXCH cytochrome family protein